MTQAVDGAGEVRRHYDFVALEDAPSLQEVVDLFVAGGSAKTSQSSQLDWQYNQNPNGRAVGFNAYHQGELAAHYVTVPVRSRLFGRETRGLLSINTRTAEAHQGQGLFTRLARLTYDRARELGYGFVIGAANQNSAPGFTNKLGFQDVGRLETRLIFGAPAPRPIADADYESLWDRDTLAWRLANPSKTYQARATGGRALIFGPSQRFRALVGDTPLDAWPPGIGRPAASPNPLSIWVGFNAGEVWRGSPTLRVPARLRPVDHHLIFLNLQGDRLLEPSRVRFAGLDFDAY